MPEMNGLTATRLIRAAEPADPHVPIVGLTAGSRAENLADCLDAGMDAVTTKPVTIARLRDAIAGAMTPNGSGSEPRPRPAGQAATSSRLRELDG